MPTRNAETQNFTHLLVLGLHLPLNPKYSIHLPKFISVNYCNQKGQMQTSNELAIKAEH